MDEELTRFRTVIALCHAPHRTAIMRDFKRRIAERDRT
jgi:hypothetical protein